MESSEVTIAIFTDYSKAFDTIDFSILIKKMHTLNFSKRFLNWIFKTDEVSYKLIQAFLIF